MSRDRFTEKDSCGKWRVEILQREKNQYEYQHELHGVFAQEFLYGPAFDRLAAYEDLILSPETLRRVLDEWNAWAEAKNSGLMKIMPCKPGDTVFYLTGAPSMSNNARFTRVERSRCMGLYFDDKGLQIRLDYDWKGNHGTYGYFGKTVFASLEEAVAAMEGGTNDNM